LNFAGVQFEFDPDDLDDIFTQCLDVEGLVSDWVSTLASPPKKSGGKIFNVFI